MKFLPSRYGILFLAVLFVLSVSVSAQFPKPDMNRARSYDVQNYIIRVAFERAKKKVIGDTTVQLKPLKSGFTQLDLDAVGLKFDSVVVEPGGGELKFKTSSTSVTVTLDKAYGPDDLISVRLKYTANPEKGVYFVDEEHEPNQPIQAAQIWTQGEPEEARHWFPSFDFPSDKATSEEFITAEKGETIIGNGEFLGQADNGDGTITAHYKMSIPYSTYLTSFVIGKYVKKEDTHRDIPLGFYVYSGKEFIVPVAFGRTKDMMKAFEDVTGVAFPYNKYDQTIVRNFQFGGMENISATTLADTEVFFANFDFGKATVEDLVSHELSHSWFGDMVTCKNWSELWLNEGFATFMEAVSREKLYGRDSYNRKIFSDAQQAVADDAVNKKRHGLFNVLAKPDDTLFDTTTYQKGGAVIHTLRETIGDEAFWRAINIYLNRHKFANVETPDLQKAMEEASGKNLGWFFDQWVYGAGIPKLDLKQTYSPRTHTLKITVTQTQKEDKITPQAFILPLELDIHTARSSKTEKLDIKKRMEIFTIKTDGKPADIKVDKDNKIPLKVVKVAPIIIV